LCVLCGSNSLFWRTWWFNLFFAIFTPAANFQIFRHISPPLFQGEIRHPSGENSPNSPPPKMFTLAANSRFAANHEQIISIACQSQSFLLRLVSKIEKGLYRNAKIPYSITLAADRPRCLRSGRNPGTHHHTCRPARPFSV